MECLYTLSEVEKKLSFEWEISIIFDVNVAVFFLKVKLQLRKYFILFSVMKNGALLSGGGSAQ